MASDKPKITSPRARVFMADGLEYEVQTANPDMVLWDRIRNKNQWPNVKEASSLWFTFVTWNASKRLGHIPKDMPFAVFEAEALECQVIEDETDLDRVLAALRPLLEAARDGVAMSAAAVSTVAEAVAEAVEKDDDPAADVAPVPPTNQVIAATS